MCTKHTKGQRKLRKPGQKPRGFKPGKHPNRKKKHSRG